MDQISTNDPQAVSLQALVWVLGDDARARRFLALTGLDPYTLRDHLSDPAVLRGVVEFLEGHEPDLVACAAALGVTPAALLVLKDRL